MTTTVAFFDLDYTLLSTSSGILYVREALRQRRVSLATIMSIGVRQRLKIINFGEAHGLLIRHIARHGWSEAQSFFDDWVPRLVFPRLAPKGLARIAWHQAQGHHVVLISASIHEIVGKVATHLDLREADSLSTRLAVSDDHYTGAIEGPACYGPGKVQWAKQWAAQNNLHFEQLTTYFYTDSSSDVPLLELSTYPVAVNPSRRLKRIAAQRDWSMERFY